MGVDQNKGSWGSYNRRSTANQSRSQRWQSRKGFVLCDTILHRKKCIVHHSSKYTNIYSSHMPVQRSIQTEWHAGATCRKWARDMAWASDYIGVFLNRLTITDQSRTNRGFFDQLETKSAKTNTLQMLCLIWEFDVLTFLCFVCYWQFEIGARMHHYLNDIIMFHHDILLSFSTMTYLFLEVV